MKITIQYNIDQQLQVKFDDDDESSERTVLDLKLKIVQELSQLIQTTQDIKLIYRGRPLIDNEQSLHSVGMHDGSVVHMVLSQQDGSLQQTSQQRQNSSSNNSQRTPISLKALDKMNQQEDMMAQALKNPFAQSLLQNKELMRNMLMSDPRTQKAMEKNPSLRQMLNSDSFMEEISSLSSSPAKMKELLRGADRAMLNIENIPGGFQALRGLIEEIDDPLQAAPELDKDEEEAKSRLAKLHLNIQDVDQNQLNTSPLPNPWDRRSAQSPFSMSSSNRGRMTDPFQFMQSSQSNNSISNNSRLQQLASGDPASIQGQSKLRNSTHSDINPFAFNAFNPHSTSSRLSRLSASEAPQSSSGRERSQHQSFQEDESLDIESYSELYKDQLEQLSDMGFTDLEENIKALKAVDGDLARAIDEYFSLLN
ncbi:hypothetical protein MP228_001514 [Amoeboaphelidium protococcarum]|nr:hypothetical protein MP228_001514 [Amoeboaphelidium protococcarum]